MLIHRYYFAYNCILLCNDDFLSPIYLCAGEKKSEKLLKNHKKQEFW